MVFAVEVLAAMGHLRDQQHSHPAAKNSETVFRNALPSICICSARHFITWTGFLWLGGGGGAVGLGAPADVTVAIIKEIYAS